MTGDAPGGRPAGGRRAARGAVAPPFTVRRARPADVDVVDRLLGDFAAEDGWPRQSICDAERAAFGRDRTGAMHVWLAVAADGTPFGFAAAHEAHDLPEGQGAWLSDLYVAAPWRRHGAGRALITAVARWSRSRGGRWVMLHTDPNDADARRFYASVGARERPSHLLVTLKWDAAPPTPKASSPRRTPRTPPAAGSSSRRSARGPGRASTSTPARRGRAD